MTDPKALDEAIGRAPLLDRLRAMYSHRGDGLPTQPVNPDGWGAAAEIERLRARVARLEGALANSIHALAYCWRECRYAPAAAPKRVMDKVDRDLPEFRIALADRDADGGRDEG